MNASKRALVLRPEPGNGRTVAALRALGVEALGIPLFEIRPLTWTVPATEHVDALLLTSANAVEAAGEGLATLAHLPVVAVGAATARVAHAAGLRVAVTGQGDAAAAVAAASALPRMLHLAGREHVTLPGVERVIVYASEPVQVEPDRIAAAVDGVVLLHSTRAAEQFAALARALPRARIMLAAISATVAAAAGEGWRRVAIARTPSDACLVDRAAALLAIDPAGTPEDNVRHE